MKSKNTIFSKSYKIGVTIFSILVLIVSFTLFSILRTFDFSKNTNVITEPTENTYHSDTVRIEVEKPVRVVDTVYISCKKKHCEEIHTTKDTTI